jgi:hypothetical protein
MESKEATPMVQAFKRTSFGFAVAFHLRQVNAAIKMVSFNNLINNRLIRN